MRRYYRRRYYRGYGDIGIGLDAFLPPLVGGGTAMGTTLLLRGFVPRWKKEGENGAYVFEEGKPVQHWAHEYAGLIGMGAGLIASVVLGPFKGWGSAISGGITALLAGGTAQLYESVVKEEERLAPPVTGYRAMVARPAPFGQPYPWRGGARLGYQRQGYRQLQAARPADPSYPENVTAFPADYQNRINYAAFGGRSF